MNTNQNRSAILAKFLRAAVSEIAWSTLCDPQFDAGGERRSNAVASIIAVAEELDKIAAERPSDGELLEWVMEHTDLKTHMQSEHPHWDPDKGAEALAT